LTGELQIAQKWSGILKSILITNKNWENKFYKSKLRVSSSLNKPMIHEHSTFYSIKRKDRHISREVLTN
jgi:hypothetical protein